MQRTEPLDSNAAVQHFWRNAKIPETCPMSAAPRALFERARISPFRTCQWPFGDPQEEAFHYCGAPVLAPHSYCAHHVERAYRDPDEEGQEEERQEREPARAAA